MAATSGETRSARKRREIMEAATEAFLANGYSRTTMDQVARLAAVSKQTIYQHFGTKDQLLTEVVTSIIAAVGEPADALIAGLTEASDLEAALRAHAVQQLTAVLQPTPMRLRRLVIAEATTFPELGALFHRLGPEAAVELMAPSLAELGRRGRLRVTDPRQAAADLNWLIMSDALNRAMLLGIEDPPSRRQIKLWADRAVSTFLAAYGRRRSGPDDPGGRDLPPPVTTADPTDSASP